MSQIPPLKPHEGYQPPKTEIAESPIAVQLNSSGGRLSYALHQFLNFIWSFTFGFATKTVCFSDWKHKKQIVGKLSERMKEFSNSKTNYAQLFKSLNVMTLINLENLFEKYPKAAPKYLASLNVKDFITEARSLNEQKLKDPSK